MYQLDRFVGARALIEQAIAERKLGMNEGTINYESVAASMEKLKPFEIFRNLIELKNQIGDFWMPFIDMFTEIPDENSSNMVITEKYQNYKVETSTLRGDTQTGTIEERSVVIPVSNQEVKIRWVNRDWKRNPLGVLSDIPNNVSIAFRNDHIEKFLGSLLRIPTDQSATTACLYRDTSTFDAANQIIPYPHGFQTFTNAETHYIYATSVATSNLSTLRKKVESKGYGKSGLYYIASASYWEEMMALPGWSENVQAMFEMQDKFFDGRGGDKYIKVPDVYMPGKTGEFYVIAIDPSVKTLRKVRPTDKDGRGVLITVDNESSLEVVNELKFVEEGVGFGIQNRGSAAALYIKAGATAYVNPDVSIKG